MKMDYHSSSSSMQECKAFYENAIEDNVNKICCCCLSKHTTMVNLQECKHTEFLLNFLQMDLANSSVCLFCHSMLVKITLFHKQIIESTTILNRKLSSSLPKKLHTLRIFNAIKTSKSEYDDDTEEGFLKIEPSNELSLEFETEVKIENNSGSEFENDQPLSEVKKEGRKKRVQTVSYENDVKYKGKIMVYNLNLDELNEEREREARKDSYVKLPYKCENCIKGFDLEYTLSIHNDKHHTQIKGGIQCDVCKTILKPLSYKEHERRHYRRYQCVICGKRSQDIFSISQHFNQQHGGAGPIPHEFSCTECDFTTSSNRAYRYHRDKHKQKQQCTECGNTYVNANTLRVHMLNVHHQTQYKCPDCDKTYNSKSGLHSHRASTHSSLSAYCAECRAHFRTPHGLARHLATHSTHRDQQHRRFECAECGSRFLKKSLLQAHIDWTHLKKSSNQCTKCNKVFKRAASLKHHISFVHEKKRLPRDKICDYCGRGFTVSPYINKIFHILRMNE